MLETALTELYSLQGLPAAKGRSKESGDFSPDSFAAPEVVVSLSESRELYSLRRALVPYFSDCAALALNGNVQ
jgi:hypothetical protein